jgi:hypothetical protein
MLIPQAWEKHLLFQLCQAEIQNLSLAVGRNKDVGWLDVAMNDALPMRRVQPTGNLNRNVQQFVDL